MTLKDSIVSLGLLVSVKNIIMHVGKYLCKTVISECLEKTYSHCVN